MYRKAGGSACCLLLLALLATSSSSSTALQLAQLGGGFSFMTSSTPDRSREQVTMAEAREHAAGAEAGAGVAAANVAPARVDPLFVEILRNHNTYRRRHQVGVVTWNDNLAAQAYVSAGRCSLSSDGSAAAGENVFVTSASDNLEDPLSWATEVWYSGIENYDFSKPGYVQAAGAATQVIWKSTRNLGCDARVCYNGIKGTSWTKGVVVVCRYSPAGNMIGDFKDNVFPAASLPSPSPAIPSPASPSPAPPASSPEPPATEGDLTVPAGTVVASPDCWWSGDRAVGLCMQSNAVVVMYVNGMVQWASNTAGRSTAQPFTVEVLRSGKFVAYDATGKIFWDSK